MIQYLEEFRKGLRKFAEQIRIVEETYGLQMALEIMQITFVYLANARSDINESYYDQLQKLDSKQIETLSLALLEMKTKEELYKYL